MARKPPSKHRMRNAAATLPDEKLLRGAEQKAFECNGHRANRSPSRLAHPEKEKVRF